MAKSKAHSKKKRKKSSISIRNVVLFVGAFCVSIGIFILAFSLIHSHEEIETPKMSRVCEIVEKNYGHEIDSCAAVLNISAEYFKALACLECSGRTDLPKRFEKHIYKNLKKVRNGTLASYEGITKKMIADASDEALKNLATSWGPFQIMGYKCLHLDVKVADLRGNNAVYWGMKWAKGEYGHLLKKERYKDAFHYHNTGRTFPADGNPITYDKKYVPNGLKYMGEFEKVKR